MYPLKKLNVWVKVIEKANVNIIYIRFEPICCESGSLPWTITTTEILWSCNPHPHKGEDYIIAAIDNVSTHFLPYVSIAMVRLNCDQQRLIKWYTVHLFFLNCHFVSYIDQWIYYTIMTYKNKIVQNIVALIYNGAEQGF